jgi:hypothetical protein
MAGNSVSSSSGGVGCLTVVGIVFIILKLVGTIDWSWWLVLLPIYGPVALILVLWLTVLFFVALKHIR